MRLRFKQKVGVWIQKILHLNAKASRAEMTVSLIAQQEEILLTSTMPSWMYQFGRLSDEMRCTVHEAEHEAFNKNH